MVWGLEADLRMPMGRFGLPTCSLNANASLLQSRLDTPGGTPTRIPGQPHYLLNINLAKPIPRGAGAFGGVSLNISGAADLGDGHRPPADGSGRFRRWTSITDRSSRAWASGVSALPMSATPCASRSATIVT
jgi:hypothetical protein